MPTRTAAPAHPRRGAPRSPLAAATQSPLPPICSPANAGPAPSQPAADPRPLTLAEFGDYLRTVNNRDEQALRRHHDQRLRLSRKGPRRMDDRQQPGR